MKNCPYCAEAIQDAAVKCRYCGETLNEGAERSETRSVEATVVKAAPVRSRRVVLAVSALLAVLVVSSVGVAFKRRSARVHLEQARLLREAQERQRLNSLDGNASAAYETYKKDTAETLDAIGRIEAATETGLNIMRYSELLGDVNYKVKKYKDKYSGQVEHSFIAFEKITEAMDCYVEAATAWRSKIESEYGKDLYESRVQKAWSRATLLLELARASLKIPTDKVEWRSATHYRSYVRQVSGSDVDAEFAVSHRDDLTAHLDDANVCGSNLKTLGAAIQMWSGDNNGRYPATLEQLQSKYLKELPRCPANGQYQVQSTASEGPPDLYTLTCSGSHPGPEGQIQFTSLKGLVMPTGVGDKTK